MKKLAIIAALLATIGVSACGVGEERWRAEAERPTLDEWADTSCAVPERVTQVTSEHLFGAKSYRIELFDGDDSFGERCELEQGNTSASNIQRVGGERVQFHQGDDLLIHFAYKLPADYPFKPDCSNVSICEDGGLIQQLKQDGSCGTPALGIVATGRGMFVRNSDTSTCESNPMHSIFSFPLVKEKWVEVTQRVVFSPDPSVGLVHLWTRVEGADWIDRGEVHTHTMKSPTDHQAGVCPEATPCSHARTGIYRDPDVSGHAVIYIDGWWVARYIP